MEKKIAPSEQKAQALRALLQGQVDGQNGEELLSRGVSTIFEKSYAKASSLAALSVYQPSVGEFFRRCRLTVPLHIEGILTVEA
jgi:hypothetical protein